MKFSRLSGLIALAMFLVLPPSALSEDPEIYDPLEPINRVIFWFNDQVDIYFMEPIAKGYDAVLPDVVQDRVSDFFVNLRFPQYLVSDIIQLKPKQAGLHTARFLINSTIGLAGLFDLASEFGLENQEQDFGISLAHHGVPPGPYLVIPFLGPSNLRDGIGKAADNFVHPFALLEYSNVRSGITDKIVIGGIALNAIHTRAGMIEAIKAARESSLDYYLFVQAAFYQHRRGLLSDDSKFEDEFGDELDWDE